jgi:hypothetical protein
MATTGDKPSPRLAAQRRNRRAAAAVDDKKSGPDAPGVPEAAAVSAKPPGRQQRPPAAVPGGAPPEAHVAGAAAVPAKPPEAVLFRRALQTGDEIRNVLGARLQAQAPGTAAAADLAAKAFGSFRPSALTDAERAQGIYLESVQGLDEAKAQARFDTAMDTARTRGVSKLQDTQDKRKLKLQFGDALRGNKDLDRKENPDGTGFTVSVVPFFGLLSVMLAERPPLAREPVVSQCEAEAAATQLLNQLGAHSTSTAGAGAPTSGDGQPGAGRVSRVRPRDFVDEQVSRQMATARSPEEKLAVNVDPRATLANTENAVDTFELRAGASDVTSYHDFHSLNIAFEHVWTELFDAGLTELGKALYAEAVKFEQFCVPGQATKIDPNITSIADIKRLMARIAELSAIPEDQGMESSTNHEGSGASLLDVLDPLGLIHRKPAGTPEGQTASAGGTSEGQTAEAAAAQAYLQSIQIPGAVRLSRLLQEMARRIQENYAFKVFQEGSYNFGFLVTYRQTWTPESYQVGDLVSTLPLAPRETRRYTTKRVVKTTRAAKELEDSLRTTRSETAGTSRVEREIVDKAQNKTDFDATVKGSFGGEGTYKTEYTGQAGGEASAQSEQVKKNFHESVLKSAEDYKQQHRLEIDTTTSEETEETTFHEIQNPNDELTVTYMFYELQRRYLISERIHQLTPVILLANKVPAPDEIDDAWLTAYDWILRRVILDDSFRPALDYLTKSFVGAELNIQILETNARAQKKVADDIKDQLTAQNATLKSAQEGWAQKVDAQVGVGLAEDFMTSVKNVFDPFKLTGQNAGDYSKAIQTSADFAQETVLRAERERARLIDALAAATNVLQVAIDKLAAAVKDHNERVAEIDRLRVHVKDNIIYYMQAIWSHEPKDQRFFRVFDKKVNVPLADTSKATVTKRGPDLADQFAGYGDQFPYEVTLPVSFSNKVEEKQMNEIADLDTILGYKGNYAIYPLVENNFITLSMMLEYLEFSDDVMRLRDPDQFANYTVDELLKLADCIKRHDRDTFNAHAKDLKDLIVKRLISGRSEDDRVIVPTDSLYLEALVGTHPLLEDFKLLHRSLDVKKVQAEVRHAELENIRLAARALRGKDADPDIDKTVLIKGTNPAVTINPDA